MFFLIQTKAIMRNFFNISFRRILKQAVLYGKCSGFGDTNVFYHEQNRFKGTTHNNYSSSGWKQVECVTFFKRNFGWWVVLQKKWNSVVILLENLVMIVVLIKRNGPFEWRKKFSTCRSSYITSLVHSYFLFCYELKPGKKEKPQKAWLSTSNTQVLDFLEFHFLSPVLVRVADLWR